MENKKQEIYDSNTVFVANIHYSVDKSCLNELFSIIGPVINIHFKEKFAFITYNSHENASIAAESLNSVKLYGRNLIVQKIQKNNVLLIKFDLICDEEYIKILCESFGPCKISKLDSNYSVEYKKKEDALKALKEFKENNLTCGLIKLIA